LPTNQLSRELAAKGHEVLDVMHPNRHLCCLHGESGIYRGAIVYMRDAARTKTHAARRTTKGKTRREIICCIKRHVPHEIYRARAHHRPGQTLLDKHRSINAAFESFFKRRRPSLSGGGTSPACKARRTLF
jgi:hypothetical protein